MRWRGKETEKEINREQGRREGKGRREEEVDGRWHKDSLGKGE